MIDISINIFEIADTFLKNALEFCPIGMAYGFLLSSSIYIILSWLNRTKNIDIIGGIAVGLTISPGIILGVAYLFKGFAIAIEFFYNAFLNNWNTGPGLSLILSIVWTLICIKCALGAIKVIFER